MAAEKLRNEVKSEMIDCLFQAIKLCISLPQLRRVLVYRKNLGRRRLSSLDGIVRGIEEELERSASINCCILGDPGAVTRVDKMSVVKVYCTIETSPWTLTLNEPVPEAFGLPASDWAEKFFSDQ